MRKAELREFDAAYEQFLKEKDVTLHRRALKRLLSEAGLEGELLLILDDEEDGVRNFFLLWERAGKLGEDPEERAGLRELGAKSKELYERKDYAGLCKLFQQVLFKHLADYLRLSERSDFERITDHDLFKKELIPEDIYLQFFLLETLTKARDFDWNRGEEIARQNLACLIVCFGDMYEFFEEEDEDS